MKLNKFNPKLKVIILVVLFITISILLLIKPSLPPASIPTPSLVPVTNSSLQVISSIPSESQSHSPFQPIQITFNLPIDPQTLPLTFEPKVDFSLDFDSFTKILTISPQPKFLPETNYRLTLNLTSPFTLNFTTQGEAGNIPSWNEEFAKQEQEYLDQYGAQDQALIKLRRSAPITKPTFTLEYSYSNNTYSIKISPPYDQTKTEVIDWLKTQGVTDLTNLRLNWIES